MIRVYEVRLPLDHDDVQLRSALLARLGIPAQRRRAGDESGALERLRSHGSATSTDVGAGNAGADAGGPLRQDQADPTGTCMHPEPRASVVLKTVPAPT